MDSDYLITDLDFLAVNGVTFTTEERAVLHNSLTLMKEEGKFRKVYFWGRIIGLQRSYYVAFGLRKDILRQKKIFYSLDMKKWNLLTPPLPIHNKLNKYLLKPLMGDPAYEEEVKAPVYYPVNVEEEGIEDTIESESDEENENENEEDDEVKKKDLRPGGKCISEEKFEEEELETNVITDEERLSAVVHEIDCETALAPRGAYIRTPIGEVLVNRIFTGLDLAEALKPQNYLHVRFPKVGSPRKSTSKKNSEVARTIDFLDPISEDDPKGCWSIQIDSTRDVAIVRSLWWPGMVFYYRVCSKDFGFVYSGYGEKCIDLPFML